MIKKLATEHQRIVFSGNGYGEEWVKEAKKRGLPSINSLVEAIPALTTDATVSMFEKFGVFSKVELESRAEIEYEQYIKSINIEARTMIDMASKQIIPAVISYATELGLSIGTIADACPEADVSTQKELLIKLSNLLRESKDALVTLRETNEKAYTMKATSCKKANYYHDEVVKAMENLRRPVDALEMIVDKESWPMPSYGDMIFEV